MPAVDGRCYWLSFDRWLCAFFTTGASAVKQESVVRLCVTVFQGAFVCVCVYRRRDVCHLTVPVDSKCGVAQRMDTRPLRP